MKFIFISLFLLRFQLFLISFWLSVCENFKILSIYWEMDIMEDSVRNKLQK